MTQKHLKKYLLATIKEDWGPRCQTKDYEDFPEVKEVSENRCPCCLVYEKFDEFWEAFDPK
jgi:hypothetical protein